MYIHTLTLQKFRNYENQTITFDSKLNVIYGDNAQGKTNILEAIYVCATSKSHRTNAFKEMITMGQKESHISLSLEKEDGSHQLDVHLRYNNKKQIAINKSPIKKMDDLLGVIHVIMFSPEDLNLIKSGPKERRRFIDIELSQFDRLYYHHLHDYHHLLKQRNALLKQCQSSYGQDLEAYKNQLEVWDMQLVAAGKKVIEYRADFVDKLNEIYQKRHYDISGGRENIRLIYEKNVESTFFEEKIKKNLSQDIRFGSTSVGPHRDDLKFEMEGVDLRKYGSQGQQRTAALSLKLSEIDLVIREKGIKPILLLDDVLSELDIHRQNYLLENLAGIQTFITCTGIEDFVSRKTQEGKIFRVIAGEIA